MFSDFRKFCENQKTNILAFLHISKVGLSKAGCSGSGKCLIQYLLHMHLVNLHESKVEDKCMLHTSK